ncbi:hypothetical protein DH2020_040241 [Rehmannia glutinosa]|uniref:Uncharacterized protein n=1 Tax=Rehmannia glutinosa TaxID=99300 RepID=A0ABR0UUR8_REHGL
MVIFRSLGWLPEQIPRRHSAEGKKEGSKLGILAFETAKTMSRLVSLYKSLSDEEILKLKNDVVKSKGVAFLNSMDEGFLLSLACAERLEDLDRAATSVSWLGKKCNDLGLNRFDLFYTDLKLGIVDLGKSECYGSRVAEKRVRKMEKLVSTTSFLHAALEGLAEMEISERKIKLMKNRQIEMMKANFDLFNQKLENQRKDVRYFREISLWSKTFDKSVDLMARIVCVVYSRICSVFGPQKKLSPEKFVPYSGPLLTKSNPIMVRFYSRRSNTIFSDEDGNHFGPDDDAKNNRVFHIAGPSTTGGSGLAMRYANVIILSEKYLDSSISITHDERESFYEMLPENLKSMVRTKLSKNMRCAENDELLAEGWRDAVEEMMTWLAPMAHDTVKWQMERNFEKMKFDKKANNSVLLLQTLHFSDREKTEAAIAEVELPKEQPKFQAPFLGFTRTAEIWNSRACMIGLIGTFIVELILNKGILQVIGVDVGKGLDIPL